MEPNIKKYIKEAIILTIQILMFYIIPLLAGPTDAMGMVVIIILAIFIYYNESALIHSIWYLIISPIGLTIGTIINKITNKK